MIWGGTLILGSHFLTNFLPRKLVLRGEQCPSRLIKGMLVSSKASIEAVCMCKGDLSLLSLCKPFIHSEDILEKDEKEGVTV